METTLRHREILFSPLHPQHNQARSAMLLLADIDGVDQLTILSHCQLSISYDVLLITLSDIEQALVDVGFHLDNNLLAKLKRALYYYTEETLRANLGCHNCTRDIFMDSYQRRLHGCRDRRPEHWRNYL